MSAKLLFESTCPFSELPQYCSYSEMFINILLLVITAAPQCILEYKNAAIYSSISNYKDSRQIINTHVMCTVTLM